LVVNGEGPVYTDQGLIVYLAPDAVNWGERIEIIHVAGGFRSPDDFGTFAAAVCGASD
jgi:hypothetical protein